MANSRVLKAVSVALAALAELDPKEQAIAMEAIQNAMKAGRPPISDWINTADDR